MTIGVDPTKRTEHFRAEAEALPTPPRKTPPDVHRPSEDAGILDFAKRSAPVVQHATAERSLDDGILYLSMNKDSGAAELAVLGPNATNVGHSAMNDTIDYGGRTYDLRHEAQAKAFATALGVSPHVGDVLFHANPASRDELARIAMAWSPAERSGAVVPSRLVISGHSDGDSLYGSGDALVFADVRKLAIAMPRAAACIEDIHLAGCNTGKNGTADWAGLKEAFPALRTFWGYQGSSPLAPLDHLRAWEMQTRGGASSLSPTEPMIREGVTVIDSSGKVDGKYARFSHAELQAKLDDAMDYFEHFDNGWEPLVPNENTRLYEDYQYFQAAVGRPDFAANKGTYQALANKMLRLRYYDLGVRTNFQKTNAALIDAGYRAAGLPPPDFSKLDRKSANAQIDLYFSKTTEGPLADQLIGLRNLDPDTIPTSWCVH